MACFERREVFFITANVGCIHIHTGDIKSAVAKGSHKTLPQFWRYSFDVHKEVYSLMGSSSSISKNIAFCFVSSYSIGDNEMVSDFAEAGQLDHDNLCPETEHPLYQEGFTCRVSQYT